MGVTSKVLLLIWLLFLFFELRRNRTTFYVTRDAIPRIRRCTWNALLILGSDEELMLFLGILETVLQVV
jgi:hypothetical protein